jgi:carboxylesterase type B
MATFLDTHPMEAWLNAKQSKRPLGTAAVKYVFGKCVQLAHWTHPPEISYLFKRFYSTQRNLVPGVCHGSEVAYLFKAFYIDEAKLSPNTDYMKTVSRMVKLWTNFAKTG